MKFSATLSACACAALACNAPVFAQSSVTLYGLVDAGITYANNAGGKSQVSATSGNEQGSRVGFLGREDIGGGNSVVFKLENGFNIENGALGQGGRMFGRQAWVGMANRSLGTLSMGRQYNSIQENLQELSIAGSSLVTQYGMHPFDTDALNNTFRTNNTIKYVSPVLSGFRADALYGFSNASNFGANRSWSVGAQYKAGPVSLGAAYANMNAPGTNAAGAVASDNYYTFLSGVKQQQIWGAGAIYDVGPTSVGLLYTNTLFKLNTGATRDYANYETSLRYRPFVTTNITIGETYTSATASFGAPHSAHYWQTNVGVQYYLSKRTDLYANVFYQRSTANTVAAIEGLAASTTRAQLVAIVGVRSKF
ncbi:porin [Burkholderia multivorans]|uniref:porin n=1 Tax=Burkholderia multivorans TaxID=87883 RepID=UPI001C226C13|nr:porin [Burkholderia multivorans]MBU9606697.1 porin [Burkholderia multivorans]MBU9622565.1 porin [Burkholderia multivorans]